MAVSSFTTLVQDVTNTLSTTDAGLKACPCEHVLACQFPVLQTPDENTRKPAC